MWVLRLGKKPCEWVKLEIKGAPPEPRYSHSMNYYEPGNYLIVHGGRNDMTSDSFALSDTYVLELAKLEWYQVKLYSEGDDFKVYNRCGHSSIVFSIYYPNLFSQ